MNDFILNVATIFFSMYKIKESIIKLSFILLQTNFDNIDD